MKRARPWAAPASHRGGTVRVQCREGFASMRVRKVIAPMAQDEWPRPIRFHAHLAAQVKAPYTTPQSRAGFGSSYDLRVPQILFVSNNETKPTE